MDDLHRHRIIRRVDSRRGISYPVMAAVLVFLSVYLFAGIVPPVTSYEEVKDWLKLPPGFQLGEVPGVAIDTGGHVFVFHRPGRGFEPQATELLAGPAILEIDPGTGKLLASWGANMFLVPHGITIDSANHVWVTDVGLHQVFKFSA